VQAAFDYFVKQRPNMKKIALVTDVSFPATIECRDIVYLPLLKKAGIAVADEVECNAQTQDFSALVTKIKGMNADGVVASIYPIEFVLFAKEMKRQGVTAATLPILVSAHAASPASAVAVGDAANGYIMPGWSWYRHTEDPILAKWMQRFSAEVKRQIAGHPGDPSFSEGTTYDGTMINAYILRKAKATPDMPVKELRQIVIDGWSNLKNYKGIVDTYTIPPSHDFNIVTEATVFRNGEIFPVKQ
jgi:ABC-type branched-subunit amino acid transport system substrate-binding protein